MREELIKVCHITESSSGGVMTHLGQLATYIDPSRFEQVFIFSTLKNSKFKNQSSFLGKKLLKVDMNRNIHPLNDFVSLFKLIKLLIHNKFDIIHCHSSKAGVIGRMAAFLTGHKKIVYTPHSFSFQANNSKLKISFFKFIEKCMAKITAKIICVSEGEYKDALKANISNRKTLTIIRNGVMVKEQREKPSKELWLKSKGFSGKEKIIGFVGRLAKQKNPGMLIQACKELPFPFVLVIIGKGELLNELKDLGEAIGINRHILFLGEVENAQEYMAYFDAFVSTSNWEGMPYAILEAMAADIPVIATDISGVTDLVIHNETGFIVPANGILALNKKIINTISSNHDDIVLNAKELVLREYTVNEMINKLQQLYEQLGKE